MTGRKRKLVLLTDHLDQHLSDREVYEATQDMVGTLNAMAESLSRMTNQEGDRLFEPGHHVQPPATQQPPAATGECCTAPCCREARALAERVLRLHARS